MLTRTEDKLVSEKHGDDYYIRYHYGLDNRVMFFELIDNNVKQKYYYLWNSLEIIGIVNQNGEVVVTYSYDAYGNVTIGGIDASTIGVKNPFLYRGYYYDHETKLYYCLSRYYNPSWRRWISLDDVSYLEPSKITGLNLFAYCNNDPINKWDPSGHIPIVLSIIISTFSTFYHINSNSRCFN